MEMDLPDDALLDTECRYLYSCLFRTSAPSRIIQKYVLAHKELPSLRECPAQEYATVQTIVDRRLDATAIEPWLRRKGNRHALTQKLLLLAYLAERDGVREEFSRRAQGRVRGWVALIFGGMKGLALLAVGYAEKRVYGLV